MDDNQESRVFIGNLPMEADQVEIRERFKKYGVIQNITILKGFAFVQFSMEEFAKAAIQKEAGTTFFDKVIDVKPARRNAKPPTSDASNNYDNNCNIVAHIDFLLIW